MLFNAYKDAMLDKPSLVGDYCAVCGRYCTDGHHVVQKGMGGVSAETERRIPIMSLCRSCHEEHHAKRLHLQWNGRWLWLWCPEQMSDQRAWDCYRAHYSPCKGHGSITFGGGR